MDEARFATRDRTVLVVGGAGYVGSVVCAELLAAGYHVIALDALFYGEQSLGPIYGHPNFEFVLGDTRDTGTVWQLLRRVGSVVHLGEIVGDPACDLDPTVTVSVNYEATASLAENAKRAGVTRFIYPSSCSVYGATDDVVGEDDDLAPVSLYGRLKQATERTILGLGSDEFHPTIFRLATVYGLSPRPRFDLVVNTLAGRAAADREIVVQGGGQWRPFVHVRDVARVLCETLAAPTDRVGGQLFNLGSNDQNHTIAGVADIVRDHVTGVDVRVTPGVDPRNYRVAFDKIASTLQFRPRYTVVDGVREIAAAVAGGNLDDVRSPIYSNVRALIETDARHRLWRSEFADGDPANPFRGRDLEMTVRTPIRRRAEVAEEASA